MTRTKLHTLEVRPTMGDICTVVASVPPFCSPLRISKPYLGVEGSGGEEGVGGGERGGEGRSGWRGGEGGGEGVITLTN